ncbi:glycosyltransferase family A protein [Neoroseomonas soli]|uniref:Glycosyltransferase family 2 protein n=1 Tax=Neoroseomonas soli TaxID=1081025 RepID=A0A9X9WZT9_9PROT|nr:glycosyltransferase family 2 protein [Neoroseomonas soli]MBR0672668.1 glycosyltransferase family 2 protein [Neoroseomonas soli]
MTDTPDITVTVILHREGPLALPALSSMHDLVMRARAAGLAVEARAVLDRPDDLTRRMAATRGNWLDAVQEVSVGDLGLARNAGVAAAHGRFLAFLDGDDLWGEDWLHLAHRAATAANAPPEAIWHPQSLYYFVEGDFDRHSTHEMPHAAAQSFHMWHHASDTPGFDRDVLFLNNIWTANVFARREIHERHPYTAVDRSRGFGVEDWSWHMETLWDGLGHFVVPDTVHLIRVKDAGSLGQQNTAEGLLPHLPPGAAPRLGPQRSAPQGAEAV